MNYWGLIANPQIYDIERAVKEFAVDSWTTGRSYLEAGDYGVIWKSLGGSKDRGIIAFFEVLEGTIPREEMTKEFWVDTSRMNTVEPRAIVRYISDDALPYWYGPESAQIRDRTSLPRAQGSVARITPDQWELLVEAIHQ